MKAGNCSYLVRPSDQSPGDFTLFFNADNIVHRFRITGCLNRTPNAIEKYFHIGGRDFTSISAIVQRYMSEDITEGYRLTRQSHKRLFNAYPQEALSAENSNYFKMPIEENNLAVKPEQAFVDFTNGNFKKRNVSFLYKSNHEDYSVLNNLSTSLNESCLQSLKNNSSTITQQQPRTGIKRNNTLKSHASIDRNMSSLNINLAKTVNKNQNQNTIMSKSLSSPFSFQSNNGNNKGDFYDSTMTTSTNRSGTYLKTSSSSSSSSNKSNEPSHSNILNFMTNNNKNVFNSSPIESNLINKKIDKIILKGYLNKYSEKLSFVSC